MVLNQIFVFNLLAILSSFAYQYILNITFQKISPQNLSSKSNTSLPDFIWAIKIKDNQLEKIMNVKFWFSWIIIKPNIPFDYVSFVLYF